MSYNTEFKNSWTLNKKLDKVTHDFLVDFSKTQHMARSLHAIYGIQGEFYVGDNYATLISNTLPSTQPGFYCNWIPTEDGMGIKWDGGEKFNNYIEWIKYLISKVLAPRGYVLNGIVKWRGEDFDDIGSIIIIDNVVNGERLIVDYSINKLLPMVEEKKPEEKKIMNFVIHCPTEKEFDVVNEFIAALGYKKKKYDSFYDYAGVFTSKLGGVPNYDRCSNDCYIFDTDRSVPTVPIRKLSLAKAIELYAPSYKPTSPPKQTGVSSVTGKKTKHQKAKERQQAIVQSLEDEIASLKKALKESTIPKLSDSAMLTKTKLLENIRVRCGYTSSSLEDFKEFLQALVKE